MDGKKVTIWLAFIGIVLIIIFILFFYSSNKEISAKVVADGEKEENKIAKSCVDYENGIDYYASGTLNYCDENGCADVKDSCSGTKLTEVYCENNEKKDIIYDCGAECDDGACVNLVTEKKYLSGGGGGGGGGGSSSSSVPEGDSSQTYNLGQISQELTLEVLKGDHISFSAGDSQYTFTLDYINPNEMSVSGSQSFSIAVGDEKDLDLNNDGTYDFYLRLRSVNLISNKIKITLNLK